MLYHFSLSDNSLEYFIPLSPVGSNIQYVLKPESNDRALPKQKWWKNEDIIKMAMLLERYFEYLSQMNEIHCQYDVFILIYNIPELFFDKHIV